MVKVDLTGIKIPDKAIDNICETILAEVLKEGVEIARSNMTHIDTGETLASIRSEQEGNKGRLLANGAAVWLEFGTGVRYNSDTHPEQATAGVKAIGTYGKGHGSNPNGWWYPSEKGTWTPKIGDYAGQPMAHTFGIGQTRFMYNTIKTLKKDIAKIAKRALK